MELNENTSPDHHVTDMIPSRDLVDAKDLSSVIIVKLPVEEVVEGSLDRKLIMAHTNLRLTYDTWHQRGTFLIAPSLHKTV